MSYRCRHLKQKHTTAGEGTADTAGDARGSGLWPLHHPSGWDTARITAPTSTPTHLLPVGVWSLRYNQISHLGDWALWQNRTGLLHLCPHKDVFE